MIRTEDLPTFYRCLASELAGPIRADVSSDYTRKLVDSLLFVLNRLIAESDKFPEIAAEKTPIWAKLDQNFAQITGGEVSKAPELDQQTSNIQSKLQDPMAFAQFLEAVRTGEQGAKTWFRTATAELNDIAQRMEDALAPPPAKGGGEARVEAPPEVLRAKLDAYLAERYPSLGKAPILEFTVTAGGQAKRTVLFTLKPNDVLPQKLVLRLDLEFSVSGTVVTDEYKIIERVHALGLPVPRQVLLEEDPRHLGGQFMLMTEIENAVGAGTYFAEERKLLGHHMGPEFAHELAGVLARLHRNTLQPGPARWDMRSAVEKSLVEWRELRKPAMSLSFELAAMWLLAHPLPADRPQCLVHGDAGAHNALTRDGHLAALLDWELAHIGDPAEDLAQVKMMVVDGMTDWGDFERAYIAQGGPAAACDPLAIAAFSIWTFLKHAVLNARVTEWFVSGKRDDAPAASMASHFLDRLMLYQSRALNNAILSVHD